MLNIVLVEPEIPQNTGNVARTCACIGARLHLVEPMGFAVTQRNLARAGCDYWDDVDIVRWSCADEFFEAHAADELHLFTGHVQASYASVSYGRDAYLVFGRESRGLDEAVMQRFASAYARGYAELKLKQFGGNCRVRGTAATGLAEHGVKPSRLWRFRDGNREQAKGGAIWTRSAKRRAAKALLPSESTVQLLRLAAKVTPQANLRVAARLRAQQGLRLLAAPARFRVQAPRQRFPARTDRRAARGVCAGKRAFLRL